MSKITLRWSAILLVLAFQSFLLLRHDLGHGAGYGHSYFFNAPWVLEFNDSLAHGHFPPRWLHGAWGGLGASSFYFYPPLAFYVAAVVRYAFGTIDHAMILAWATYLMTLGSGVAMFAWLRARTGDVWALIGAVVYVAAPYHLVDLYVRAAIGETAAYMTLPLFALCLQRASRSWRWVPGLALSAAALVMSHLLIAMLVFITLAPPYAVYLLLDARPEARRGVLARCAVGALLGLALSASYLGPAMLMQKMALLRVMWAGDAQPYKWTLLNPALWPMKPFSTSLALMAYGWAGAAVAALAAVAGRRLSAAQREVGAWSVGVLIAFALYAMPWVWQGVTGQLLGKAQFPFRLLVGVEFAAITALAIAFSQGQRRILLAVLVLIAAVPLGRGLALQKSAIDFHHMQVGDLFEPQPAPQITCRAAPEEHLPAAFGGGERYAADRYCMTGYGAPLAYSKDPAAKVTASNVFPDGSVAVAVEASGPARIVLRKYYFPTWEVGLVQKGRDPVMKTQPAEQEALLSFVAEPGAHTYRARIVRSPLEKVCDGLSLAALAICLAWLAPSARRRFRA